MIELIPDMPTDTLGFSAHGTVTGGDYERVVVPAVEAMLTTTPKVRLLYHLGPDFEGFDAAALWDDARLGFRHAFGWERIAVVTDVEWLRAAIRLLHFSIAGEVRVFADAEFDRARQWICAPRAAADGAKA